MNYVAISMEINSGGGKRQSGSGQYRYIIRGDQKARTGIIDQPFFLSIIPIVRKAQQEITHRNYGGKDENADTD